MSGSSGLDPLVEALQPDLPPVRPDSSRAQQPSAGIVTQAIDVLEHDAWILEMHHFSGLLVDDLAHSFDHGRPAATVSRIVGADEKTPIALRLIDGRIDVLQTPDLDPLTDLETEFAGGC